MDLVPGDVVLVEVRFHQAPGAKVRPAVVVLDSAMRTLLALRSPRGDARPEFDLNLAGWQAAGLNVPSIARVHKLAVLAKASIRQVLGRLSDDDLADLRAALCRAFCPRTE